MSGGRLRNNNMTPDEAESAVRVLAAPSPGRARRGRPMAQQSELGGRVPGESVRAPSVTRKCSVRLLHSEARTSRRHASVDCSRFCCPRRARMGSCRIEPRTVQLRDADDGHGRFAGSAAGGAGLTRHSPGAFRYAVGYRGRAVSSRTPQADRTRSPPGHTKTPRRGSGAGSSVVRVGRCRMGPVPARPWWRAGGRPSPPPPPLLAAAVVRGPHDLINLKRRKWCCCLRRRTVPGSGHPWPAGPGGQTDARPASMPRPRTSSGATAFGGGP